MVDALDSKSNGVTRGGSSPLSGTNNFQHCQYLKNFFFGYTSTMTKNRLESFSDGVMAIVVTLLAFELKAPTFTQPDHLKNVSQLFMLAPEFFIFVLSFLTISIMWINHHYITNKIEVVTYRTVWANSLLLLFITLIPFTTVFLAHNPHNQVSLIFYSIVMLCASVSFTFLKHSSVPKNIYTNKREFFRHVGIYAYTFAILVAAFLPALTYFVLVVPPLSYILPGWERVRKIK